MSRKRITEVEREIMREIAANLKSILIKKKKNQKQLSDLTGLSTSAISDYINAKTLMTPSIIQTVAEALGVQAKDISGSLTTVDNGGYIPDGVPLIGTICAGEGLLAQQNIENYVQYPFMNKSQPDFALRVKGDSMCEVGIEDGDIVYMRSASWADFNGQIVAAIINDQEDGTLKRLKWTEGSPLMQLHPENKNYSTMELSPGEFKVCGVYMGHFKPVKELA
ncbi:S24 family peptidase [Paenibacillus sp. 11B]|nr:S24 family peptidase [Paenibacillus sp. 11B]MDN8590972.1 S24 family peptidase [Paenibacillus sp. 11B]